MRERDMPAFPIVAKGNGDDAVDPGLTKLEHTAVQMMQAAGHPGLGAPDGNFKHCAKSAVKAANALWDELEKQS